MSKTTCLLPIAGRIKSQADSLLRAWLYMSSIGDEDDLGPPTVPRFKGLESEASNKQRFKDLPTASQAGAFDLAVMESINSREDDGVLISFDAVHEFLEEKRGAKLTDEKPFDSQSKVAARTFEWRSSKVRFTRDIGTCPAGLSGAHP
jgi:hypothetical protein